jgi:hypothetical protein
MKTKCLILFSLFLSLFSSAATNEAVKANLKPVEGAFGWKLGDKFPVALKGNERFSADGQSYRFNPKIGLPMFDSKVGWEVCLLNDGRIACISTLGWTSSLSEFAESRDRLISSLTEKYGLRNTLESTDEGMRTKWYYFGTQERSACLLCQDYQSDAKHEQKYDLSLEYYDDALKKVRDAEQKVRDEKAEATKRSALGKSL